MEQIDYSSFPLTKLVHSKELPGDLFLFVNGKFIKLYNSGDSLTVEKYDLLIIKKINFVFIVSSDLNLFENWSLESKQEEAHLVADENEDIKEIAGSARAIKDDFLNYISQDLEDKDIKELVQKTKDLSAKVLAKKSVGTLITKMMSTNSSMADHASNVANIAIYLGVNIGYSHQILLENLYLGGLFHDYGKITIDRELLENKESIEYKKAYRNHPTSGRFALLAETEFSDEVLDIVGQHHERVDGKGYPKGIKGARIYELSKVVSIANMFDRLVSESSGTLKERQQIALVVLKKDEGAQFDARILGKAIKCLELVVNG